MYGEIVGALVRVGEPIGVADSMIAATALANDLTLVTRNQKHFKRVRGLRIAGW